MVDKIISQPFAKKYLTNIVKSGKIGNAYLFYGPPYVGKTTLAKEFAKMINDCIEIEDCSDFIMVIPTAYKLASRFETKIRIDDIREVCRLLSYKIAKLKYRVVIIKCAELMTEEASNALLKILEEPPENTVFILTTNNIDELLPTIRSRCQKVRFTMLSMNEMKKLKLSDDILALSDGTFYFLIRFISDKFNINEIAKKFVESNPIDRLINVDMVLEKIQNLSEFLLAISEIYFNKLKEEYDKEIVHSLLALNKAYTAIKHNVNKNIILYYLCNELK